MTIQKYIPKLLSASHPIKREVFLYSAVGILGALVDLGVFFMLFSLQLSLLFSQWIAALAGFLHNHAWHHFRVFAHDQKLQKTTALAALLSLLLVFLSGPLILLVGSFSSGVLINKILILAFVAVVSFLIRKKFIFTLRNTS